MASRSLRLPLAILALGCALVVQSMGWAQTSYMTLTKALSHGTAQIDRWHWETRDKAWFEGHFYSVKAPGLVALTLPAYEVLERAGADGVAADAVRTGAERGSHPWAYRGLQVNNYGYDKARALHTRTTIENEAPIVWALGLLGVLAPAIALLVLVARCAERVARGTGTATALAVGTGTMLLPFSTLYFSHALSALLGFAAFALLWAERAGPPSLRRVALAGLLSGLAVTTEYPLAIAGAIVGLYALTRGDVIRRGAAYAGGVAAGVAPLLAYNAWAFGSPLHMSYADAVAEQGRTGHLTLGLNDGGLFGITMPRAGDAASLLFSGRGLLVLTPVLAAALAGLVLWLRSGRHRAEAWTVVAITLAYWIYDAGYWLPFGGGSPGPRFLIPLVPFLGLGLAMAWRRWPGATLALAAASTATMVLATLTHPMIGDENTGEWIARVRTGEVQHTLLDIVDVAGGLPSVAPVALVIAVAFGLGVATLGPKVGARAGWGVLAIAGWAAAAMTLPALAGWAPCTERIKVCARTAAITGNHDELILVLAAAGAAGVALAVAAGARLLVRRQPEDDRAGAPFALEPQPADGPA